MQSSIVVSPELLAKLHEEARALRNASDAKTRTLFVTKRGARLELKAMNVLIDQLTKALAQEQSTSVSVRRSLITPTEAAEMLNMSRPEVVKHARNGDIKFVQRGKYMHLATRSVEAFKAKRSQEPIATKVATLAPVPAPVEAVATRSLSRKVVAMSKRARKATLSYFWGVTE